MANPSEASAAASGREASPAAADIKSKLDEQAKAKVIEGTLALASAEALVCSVINIPITQ